MIYIMNEERVMINKRERRKKRKKEEKKGEKKAHYA